METRTARIIALLVLAGGLGIALTIKPAYAIEFQLLGGSWIVQIFPAVVLGLYTTWFHRHALLAGWAAGLAAATWMAQTSNFSTTIFTLHAGITLPGYIAFYALLVNLTVAAGATIVLRLAKNQLGAAHVG